MISSSPAYFEQILPMDASCWEIEIDLEMTCLDDWITRQIANGQCSSEQYCNKRLNLALRRGSRAQHSSRAPLKYIYEQPAHTSLTKLAQAQEPTSIFDTVVQSQSEAQQSVPTSLTSLVSTGGPWGGGGVWGPKKAIAPPVASEPQGNIFGGPPSSVSPVGNSFDQIPLSSGIAEEPKPNVKMSGLFEGISASTGAPSRLTSGESRVPLKKYAKAPTTTTVPKGTNPSQPAQSKQVNLFDLESPTNTSAGGFKEASLF